MRGAISAIPADTTDVVVVCRYKHFVRLGNAGHLPANHRRHWTHIRQQLAPYVTTWKLANESDERQEALVRCLRELLRDETIAGPKLVNSRRARKASTERESTNALSSDASVRHSNVIDTLQAGAELPEAAA